MSHTYSIPRLLNHHGFGPANVTGAASTIDMSWRESFALLDALLTPAPHGRRKVYVEWGAGGSTELVAFLALNNAVPGGLRAYSIESSVEWMAHMHPRRGSNIEPSIEPMTTRAVISECAHALIGGSGPMIVDTGDQRAG